MNSLGGDLKQVSVKQMSLIEGKSLNVAAKRAIPYSVYHGTFIDVPTKNELKIRIDAVIGVDEDGIIDFIEEDYNPHFHGGLSALDFFFKSMANKGRSFNRESVEYIDISKDSTKFFFPGFIDTHIHASQYPNTGVGLEYQLLDWLKNVTFPLECAFTDKNKEGKLDLAVEVYSKVIQRTLSSGTTCGSYFTTIDAETSNLFANLLLTFGQRGFVGKVCMDHNLTYPEYEEDYDSCIASMNQIIDHCEKVNPKGEQLVKPIITPRFAPVCSRELLGYLGDLSKSKSLPIQTHISENYAENELVLNTFPEFDTYASVYDRFQLLSSSTILAHAVHLSDEECKLVKERNCSVSHCPTSNTFICSGEAPVKELLDKYQINVSLGTDVSGGFDPSILEIVKQSILVSHHRAMKNTKDNFDPKLTMSEVLYMATKGGAKAVGLGSTVGSFGIGKRWDTQLINLNSESSKLDLFPYNIPSLDDKHNVKQTKLKIKDLIGKWVFCGDDRNCVKVWCNGRLVVDKTSKCADHFVVVDKIP